MDRKFIIFILCSLMIIGGFLRFYGLAWGSPYFFHPDERNIASAVLNINFSDSLNPHFFAYGAFPIYLVSLINRIIGLFLQNNSFDRFALAILVGRFFSAILSTLLIPLVFVLAKKILVTLNNWSNWSNEANLINKDFLALLAAFLTTFSPGLIQYAHFSTFEIFLTVEYLLIATFAIEIVLTGKKRFYLLTGLFLGLACATKINSLMFIPILFLAHCLTSPTLHMKLRVATRSLWRSVARLRGAPPAVKTPWGKPPVAFGVGGWFFYKFRNKRYLFLGLLVFTITAFLASPYNLLDYPSFKSALNYESSVALGSLAVFYTQGFIKTIPLLFQLKNVFPYLLGWPLTILEMLGGLGILVMILKDKLQTLRAKILLAFIFIPAIYWLFNSFLFVQWIRYFVPLIPFGVIAAIVLIFEVGSRQSAGSDLLRNLWLTILAVVIASTMVSGLNQFLTYTQPDTRIQAAQWLNDYTTDNRSKPFILSEVYDLGITPFNTYFDPSTIALFDFYGLDPDPRLQFNPKQIALDKKSQLEELSRLLEKSDYIVLPSPRIWHTRLRLPNDFPTGFSFYQKLFDGNLGFAKIADFQNKACDKLLPIQCLWQNDNWAEETYTVFDRPEVLIFQKTKQLTTSAYYHIITFNRGL